MQEYNEFKYEYESLLKDSGLNQFSDCSNDMFGICLSLEKDNAKFNLTAIRDNHEILLKHIIDSLVVSKAICDLSPENKKLIDVGSGAGFPSLPIAASVKSLSVTAIDSTAKKVNHMNTTAEEIGLSNFEAHTIRAEEMARSDARESFDFGTARAVARLPILMELVVPLLKVNGIFIAAKGETAYSESNDSKNASKVLGCELMDTIDYTLPSLTDKRTLLIYKKIKNSGLQYPRNYSQISKKPL